MPEANGLARVENRGAGSEFFIQGLIDQSQMVRENVLIWSWLRDKSENTKKTYEQVVRSFFKRYPGVSLKAVTTSHVTAFIFEYMKGSSRRTQELYLSAIASVLNFCHREGYLDRNPCAPIKRIRIDRMESMRIPSVEEIQYLFTKVKDTRNLMILKLLYYSGLRVDELTNLKWEDLSVQNKGVKLKVIGKGQKLRWVMIPFQIYDELRKLKEEYRDESSSIFSSSRGEKGRISNRQIERIVQQEALDAGLTTKIHPHALRHAHATHALKKGAPISLVQKNLGHSNIQTTSIYLHVDADDSSGFYL